MYHYQRLNLPRMIAFGPRKCGHQVKYYFAIKKENYICKLYLSIMFVNYICQLYFSTMFVDHIYQLRLLIILVNLENNLFLQVFLQVRQTLSITVLQYINALKVYWQKLDVNPGPQCCQFGRRRTRYAQVRSLLMSRSRPTAQVVSNQRAIIVVTFLESSDGQY